MSCRAGAGAAPFFTAPAKKGGSGRWRLWAAPAPGGSGSTTLSRRTISDTANLKILVPNFDTVPNFDNFVHILAPNFDTPLKVAEIATVNFFCHPKLGQTDFRHNFFALSILKMLLLHREKMQLKQSFQNLTSTSKYPTLTNRKLQK